MRSINYIIKVRHKEEILDGLGVEVVIFQLRAPITVKLLIKLLSMLLLIIRLFICQERDLAIQLNPIFGSTGKFLMFLYLEMLIIPQIMVNT